MENKLKFLVNYQFLQKRRQDKNYSLNDIALLLGRSKTYVEQLEKPPIKNDKNGMIKTNKQFYLSVRQIIKLCRFLECLPHEIVSQNDHKLLSAIPDIPPFESIIPVTFNQFDKSYKNILLKLKNAHKNRKPIIMSIYYFLNMSKPKQQSVMDYIEMINKKSYSGDLFARKYAQIIEILHEEIHDLENKVDELSTSQNQ